MESLPLKFSQIIYSSKSINFSAYRSVSRELKETSQESRDTYQSQKSSKSQAFPQKGIAESRRRLVVERVVSVLRQINKSEVLLWKSKEFKSRSELHSLFLFFLSLRRHFSPIWLSFLNVGIFYTRGEEELKLFQ